MITLHINNIEVGMDEESLHFATLDGKGGGLVVSLPVMSVLYILQEYQKHFTIKGPVHIDGWKGWIGIP